MSNSTDTELLQRLANDDQAAYRLLFDRHYKTMLGTAINMLKDSDQAKDAVQDVFLRIWKNRHEIQIRTSVEAYLKRAVINQALGNIRTGNKFVSDEKTPEQPEKQSTPQQELEGKELKAVLDTALESLPERCRLVFIMKRLEGLSQKEIAEKLNISTKTVENQITKAVKVLREAHKKYNAEK